MSFFLWIEAKISSCKKRSFVNLILSPIIILGALNPDMALASEASTGDENNLLYDEKSEEYRKLNIKSGDFYLNLNNPYVSTNSPQYRHLAIQSAYATIAGVGAMVYLWNQPSSFTNWYDRDEKNFIRNYKNNITSIPKVDNDDFVTNYIGHPLAGATYYVMARQNDLPWYQGFLYSAIMSTFFWEYGLEAIVEVPSAQDLIVTPVAGSLIGEALHELKQMIKRNNNQILGSRIAGRVAMWVLDPLGHGTSGLHYSIFGPGAAQAAIQHPASEQSSQEAYKPYDPKKILNPQLAFQLSF